MKTKSKQLITLFIACMMFNHTTAFSDGISSMTASIPEIIAKQAEDVAANSYIYTLGSKESVTLIWDAVAEEGSPALLGCHVFKKLLPTDDWVQLTTELVTSPNGHYTFTDNTASDTDVAPLYKVEAITEDNTFELAEIAAFYLLKFMPQSERFLKMYMDFWINDGERDLGYMKVWSDNIFWGNMDLTGNRFIYVFDLAHEYGQWGCITFILVYHSGIGFQIDFCREFVTYMADTGAPYHPFGGQGAKWYYDYQDDVSTGYVLVDYVSDSIWMEKNLKVLQKTRFAYHFSDGSVHETNLGRAYVYNEGLLVFVMDGTQQRVLYDLSADEGESWTIYAPFDAACNETATAWSAIASDTIINGEKLRFIEMAWDAATDEHWAFRGLIAERIGPLDDYMFASPTAACGDAMAEGGRLRCYMDNDFGVFQTGIAPECDYLVGLNTPGATGAPTLVPNPASDEVRLGFELASNANAVVTVFSVEGRLFKQLNFNGLNAGGHSLRINIADLPAGIYLLQLQTGYELRTMKLLVR